MEKCPECFSKEVKHVNQHELICVDCGLVLDETPIEKNPFVEGRTPNSPALIQAGGQSVDGKIVKGIWLFSTKEKNLQKGLLRVDRMGSRLRLPSHVVRDAKLLFKQAHEADLTRGRSNLPFVFASVYASCNLHCLPKTPLEMVAFTEVTEKEMLRAYKLLVRELNLKVGVCDPIDLVPRFGSKLGLSPQTISLACEIIMKVKGTQAVSGKNPSTVVASALYLAGKMNGEQITQRMIANATGVIEVTIRKRSKEIENLPDN